MSRPVSIQYSKHLHIFIIITSIHPIFIINMYTPSQTCFILTSLKALSLDDLMAKAIECFKADDLTFNLNSIINATEERPSTSIMADQLAELIYFEQGRCLAVAGQWNEMTRLQLEHEALAQGLVDLEVVSDFSDWELRLKVASANYQPKPLYLDSIGDSGYESS